MNKELEEAIKLINIMIKTSNNIMSELRVDEVEALNTVLNYINNSIPTEVVKEAILKLWQKCPKNSTDEFMITERDYKIEALQGLLKNEQH